MVLGLFFLLFETEVKFIQEECGFRPIASKQSELFKSGKINTRKGRVPPRSVCAMKNIFYIHSVTCCFRD